MAGKLYERATRRCAPGEIDGALQAAIAAHAEQHQLGDVLADAVRCCETRSVRVGKPGLLARLTGSGDKDAEHRTVALFTPRHLVIAVTGEVRGTHVRSARLDGVSLADMLSADASPKLAAIAAKLGADDGVSVTATWSGSTGPEAASAFFLGLDAAEGEAFRQALTEAVAAAKQR